ncbi:type II secretion system F family protein [Aporhodopirellula aestuarii]|uniref:Type II secretion system F family protein n=1 Tax=Aporhodopirellula aestuarii TaxID=2950107 RepID=A0ABT0UB32_9BACT|nr:type II secretion system F family protein [Aporhodopirellula aestuarii]MCM2373598.1 type II secretion system F family protein [Aporhodopirellula aestuarii]
MLYQYKSKSSRGTLINGTIEAESAKEAQERLRQRGETLLSLSQGGRGSLKSSFARKKRGSHVPQQELLMLTSQLAIMCDTGVDLAEAFEESAENCAHEGLRKALLGVHADISEGLPIAEALRRQPHVFNSAYVASVAAGEASGEMSEVLFRITDVLRSEIRLRSMVKTVLAYPMILSVLSLVVLAVLLFFVLPNFGEIFKDMHVPLPVSTQVLLAFSGSLRNDFLIWFIGIGILLAVTVPLMKTQKFRELVHQFLLNGFVLKNVTRAMLTGRAFRLMGTMLQSGVPLLETIQLVRSSIKNSKYRELFNVLEKEVLNGRGIGPALSRTEFVPAGASRMIMTAEKTGRLSHVMDKVGTFYEDEGERRLQEVSKYFEPVIIICMGSLVAFIVVSILLPMLSFADIS